MYIRVLLTPDAKRTQVIKVSADEWHVSVRAPAVQNLANRALRTLIAKEYGVPVGYVRILTGHRSRSKMISIAS